MRIVQPHELSHVWPEVEGWIADAIGYGQGDENVLDVLLAVARGIYVLWWEPGKFALVVQVQHFPRQRIGCVLYLGGSDLEAIKQAVREDGLPWLRSQGVMALRVWGRKGWAKVLGMDQIGVILQSTVANGSLQ